MALVALGALIGLWILGARTYGVSADVSLDSVAQHSVSSTLIAATPSHAAIPEGFRSERSEPDQHPAPRLSDAGDASFRTTAATDSAGKVSHPNTERAQAADPGGLHAPFEEYESNAPRSSEASRPIADVGSENASETQRRHSLARDDFLAGRVLDTNGVPLSGIEIVAVAREFFDANEFTMIEQHDWQYHAVSQQDGGYIFSSIPAGEYSVQTVATARFPSASRILRSGVGSADFVIAGQRQLTLTGHVTDANGEALAWVLVSPFVTRASGAYTGADGRFAIELDTSGVQSGLSVRARRDGYRDRIIRLNAAALDGDIAQVDFVLDAVAQLTRVTGSVLTEGGTPVAGAAVRLRSADLLQDYLTATGADGQFAWPAVESGGAYELSVQAGVQYSEHLQPGIAIPDNGANFEIALARRDASRIYGRVTDVAGRSLSHFQLRLRRASPPHQTMRLRSDGAGQFVAAPAPVGELVFETGAAPHIWVRGMVANPNADTHLTLVVDWGTNELHGRVVDSDGMPLAARDIRLTWSHQAYGLTSRSSRNTAADFEGRFRFGELGPGPHTLSLQMPGYKRLDLVHDTATSGFDVEVVLEREHTTQQI